MPICRIKKLHFFRALLISFLLAATLLCASCKGENTFSSGDSLPMDTSPDAPILRAIIDPASEVRGVYIATVYNIDFPSKPNLSTAALKAEMDAILDTVLEAGLNTVYFQARPVADALYDSDIFPVSAYLTTDGELTFDPLEYIVEEGHKRNIFVHAWVNPFRAATSTKWEKIPENSPAKLHPEWTIPYADGLLYFDPGLPEVRKLIADGVREIVQNYNVDGILFDDYFYPYPEKDENGVTAGFDDTASFSLYGGDMSLADWRRQNVNETVRLVYDTVKSVSEDLRFGIAPFGIWQNDDGKNGGSPTRGMEAYSTVYADPVAWACGGYVDYIAPQIYWRFSSESAPFDELVRWWNKILDGTGTDLLISHAAHNYEEWTNPKGELKEQVFYGRHELTYRGSIFYGYDEIRRDAHGIIDELADVFTDAIIYTEPSPTGLSVQVSSPIAGSSVSTAETYLIGASSPDKPLTMNGKPVARTTGGYFSVRVHLVPGKNTFEFVQNGHTYTYEIYRTTQP